MNERVDLVVPAPGPGAGNPTVEGEPATLIAVSALRQLKVDLDAARRESAWLRQRALLSDAELRTAIRAMESGRRATGDLDFYERCTRIIERLRLALPDRAGDEATGQ